MLKYDIIVNETFHTKLTETLNIRNIDSSILQDITSYLFVNAQVMDRIIEGFQLWLGKKDASEMHPLDFFKGLLVMAEKFRKNMERHDGIVLHYIASLESESKVLSTEMQPWQYEQASDTYKPIGGIYQALLNMGLKADFIDQYYLDGSLMEIYEDALETVTSLNNLAGTTNPSINDTRDGLMTIDERLRKMYSKFFIEQFEDLRGVCSCLVLALKEAEKNIDKKGSLE
jgi:hypothetical protein